MTESVKLPDRLAILCCPNTLLLPGAIFCIRCASSCSVKLVEQDLLEREEKGLIGFLLVRDAAAPSSGDPEEIVHLHNRGVAARALNLSRKLEKTTGSVTYLVVLEGLCRFRVQELSTRGTYCTARITPLDMMKAEQDPDFIALSGQFKATAVELISIVEEVTLERVGVRDPVILLDDIDKMCFDHWDGPASALLEVFDPEQNKTFHDHYLNVPFDLSKVVFVATANIVQPIPLPLLDRMEVIELPGYTPEEKLGIAMRHLIPRVLDKDNKLYHWVGSR